MTRYMLIIKTQIFLIILLLVFLPLTGCEELGEQLAEETTNKENPAKDYGNVLRITMEEPRGNFNPVFTTTIYDRWINGLIFDPLFSHQANGKLATDNRALVDEYDVNEKGNAYIFKLNQDVTFQDGEELTAEDVVFTWETLAHPERKDETDIEWLDAVKGARAYNAGKANSIAGFSIKNDHEIHVKLEKGRSGILEDLNILVLPKHYYQYEEFDELKRMAERPLGSGPFVLQEFTPGAKVKLEKNCGYFLGSPKLDEIHFQKAAVEDLEQSLLSGEADIIDLDPLPLDRTWIQDKIDVWEESPHIDITNYFCNSYYYIGINHRNEFLQNPQIRQAMVYGISREEIFTEVLPGISRVVNTAISPLSWAYPGKANLEYYTQEIEKAKDLLERAGLTLHPEERVLQNEEGEFFKLDIVVYKEPRWMVEMAKEFKQQWAELGIQININEVSYEEAMKKITAGDTDLWFSSDTFKLEPRIGKLLCMHGTGPCNLSYYTNPLVETLIEDKNNLISLSKRKSIYHELAITLNQDLPVIFLHSERRNWGVNRRVQNFSPGEFREWYWNAHLISVKY